MKKIIVTEKPSVARDYCSVLGVTERHDGYMESEDYIITWCLGHLVTMSYPDAYDEKLKKWDLNVLPFLPDKYLYEVINTPATKKQFKIIKGLYHREDVDTIYYAGDPGREGIYIQYLVRQEAGIRQGIEEKVIWIHSQTDEEIRKGIATAKARSFYDAMALSGYMRSTEDYAIGINITRAISLKYRDFIFGAAEYEGKGAISVGRVMSCVLGMIVDREREIRNFTETPFYRVTATTKEEIEAEFFAIEGSRFHNSPLLYKENGFKEEKDARAFLSSLNKDAFTVFDVSMKSNKEYAPYLFNLAELQNECSKRFKITPDETLQIVQTLYEKKLTTYPRTDSRFLSSAVAKVIVHNLNGLLSYTPVNDIVKEILVNKNPSQIENSRYTNDKKVTDHYAIIPTGSLNGIDSLSKLEESVYHLIVKRFLSIFYEPAEKKTVKLDLLCDGEHFFATTTTIANPGYLKVITGASCGKQTVAYQTLTSYKKGDPVSIKELVIKEGKTTPPKRYNSGSIILAMENAGNLIDDEQLRAQIKGCGIGTSATRAEIIKKLQEIGYLNLNKKTQILTPSNLGEMIYEVLSLTIPSILSPKMTASWEKGLEQIKERKIKKKDYQIKLEAYIKKQVDFIKNANIDSLLLQKIKPFSSLTEADLNTLLHSNGSTHVLKGRCPLCGGEITTIRGGAYGCKNYKTSGCKFYIGEICGKKLSETQVELLLKDHHVGPIKGFTYVSKSTKKKRSFDAELILTDDGKIEFPKEVPQISSILCPSCQQPLKKSKYTFSCDCGYKINHIIAKKKITDEQIMDLIAQKEVKITGMKSKRGKTFSAFVKANENGELSFVDKEDS